MQNKGAIWIFTILLSLACLYQLSFSFFTSSFENEAEEFAQRKLDSIQAASEEELELLERSTLLDKYKNKYLSDNGSEEIYPVFGYTYTECKNKEINLGLDLAGGMSVTLEVSLPDLLIALSDNSKDPAFRQAIADAEEMQRESQENFITLFGRAWEQNNPDKKMAAVFHSRDNKDLFPREATNAEVMEILREEARVAINNTEKILRTRIDKFGVTQPTIQKQQFTGRILIELPGVKDKDRVRNVIQSTANLEFWNTYENSEVFQYLQEANNALSEKLYPDFEPANDTITGDTATTDEAVADTSLTKGQELAQDETGDTASAAEEQIAQTEADTADDEDLLEELGSDTAADGESPTDQQLSTEDQRKQFPLFSVLSPAQMNNRLMRGPVVGYASLGDTSRVNELISMDVVQDILPNDLRLLWSAEPNPRANNLMTLYAIKVDTRTGEAPLDGSVIVDASQQYDPTGQVEVSMTMDSEGARKWADMTADAASQNPKRSIAIVLDDYVYSAPTVQGEIPTGQSSISMGQGTRNEQVEEAVDLANLLKAGALPAPADIVDEAVVGPSLGEKNINDGLMSFVIALAVVLVYMVFYYRGAGLVADLALVANLFFLVGALASLQASLTLPGIAGIILTIGMAVDANVLIFERVREELRRGKGLKAALKEGYSKALSAIIDGNLTTLLTAIVLVTVGTGPIKGFATTLIIGIFTSLFSAIFITRLIFTGRTEKGKSISFWSKATKNILVKPNIPFIPKRRSFYWISIILLSAGIISIGLRGFNLGVDFTGGRTYTVKFSETVALSDVRDNLGAAFADDNGNPQVPEVKTYGSDNQVKVTTKFLVNDDSRDADQEVETALNAGLGQIGLDYNIVESRKVDPTISDDFQKSSTTAVILSLVLIFAYIVFRFKRWPYGLGAIIAMFHDVLIVLGFYSILYGLLPFSLEIDQAFIAAILTVVGYSINDTVIVFDRIREYIPEHPKESFESVVNKALNGTLSRTINTSMTTIVVLLVIFIFGGEGIRGFVFALLIGVVVGTFSSLFVASPLVVEIVGRKYNKKKQQEENS